MDNTMRERIKKKARKLAFEKDETEGIVKYENAIKKSSGKERETYKSILPQERSHLRKIKKI